MNLAAGIVVVCLLGVLAGECAPPATYTNPVGGDIRMGDPFVLRTGDEYFLYGTTSGDGFKGWRSPDMVNWTPLDYVYRRGETTWGRSNFWAPEVTEYKGKYYLVYSCNGPDRATGFRLCIAVSDSPAGPFKDLHTPWLDNGLSCIDAHLYIDDDGTPYAYFAKVGAVTQPSRFIYGEIYGVRVSADLSKAEGEPVLCSKAEQKWEEMDPKQRSVCNEGAFVFKRKGIYYMTYSAGHYASPRYGIGWASARKPLGPWTKSTANPLAQSDPAAGVSGPGHSCVTTSPDGKELFVVYHAHADPANPGGRRTVNIDRLNIDEEGWLKLVGPTRSPQPYPAGATTRPAR